MSGSEVYGAWRPCDTPIIWNSGWFLVFFAGFLALPPWHLCLCLSTLDTEKVMGHSTGPNGFQADNPHFGSERQCNQSEEDVGSLPWKSEAFHETLTIGFLTPYNQNQLSLGAMRLAVERVNNDSNLLHGRKLNFIAADIGSSDLELTSLPIRIMTKMRDSGTVAFIGGPEDTCVSEALVSAAWNLPIISYKCPDYQVSDKKTYSTFARTLPPSSKVSKSVVALLRKFDWDKIVLVVCQWKKDRWHQKLEAFKILAKLHGINITATFSLHDYIPDRFYKMEKIVSESYERTRVYVFMGEHVALVDLVRALDYRNLLDNGDYIIISVDDKICDPKIKCNYIETEYLPGSYPVYLNDTEYGSETEEVTSRKVAEILRRKVRAFRSVLKLQPSYPRLENYSDIFSLFANYSTGYPFFVPYHPMLFADSEVPIEAAYLYDAVMIYARALSEGLDQGLDPKNGSAIFEKIRNRSYHSIQGFDVYIDANGDAEGNYTVLAFMPDNSTLGEPGTGYSMKPVGYFRQNATTDPSNNLVPSFHYFAESHGGIPWVGGRVPLSEPLCGFRGERCVYKPDWGTIVVCTIFGSFLIIAAVLVARHYRYEQKLACLLWKIDMRDVIMIPNGAPETTTKNTVSLCRQLLVADTEAPHDLSASKKAYTRIGFYKGTAVAIKPIHKKTIDLTRIIRKELKQIREFRHENITPFIGASVESSNICILTAYSARGSLEDVLQNEDLHLDNMFLASLVADLIKGMIYLHDSEIVSHGNLKSSNCLVDSRWVLQITDFGLHEFKAAQEVHEDAGKVERGLLWRSPELLRQVHPPARGTQKGDVYSFGIVLYEMIGRSGPWGKTQLTTKEILQRVSEPSLNGDQYLRPSTFHLDCGETVLKCLESCWEEDPEARPDFRFIRIKLKEMQKGLKPNIFDNMLSIMEKYACNLEDLVQERTVQLMEEKKKTDALLHRMLPTPVADSLKRGEPVKAESFDSVTIYFSDIVGFTTISATSTPFQVVELLNDLYTCFDSIISSYDVYKVETIGDAYMVVSGLPLRNGNQHAGEIASMALHLLDRIQSFEIRQRAGERLKLRIGIHSGPVVAGVVGLKMPRYCLFGDTVNTASRMESSGEPLRIHISDLTQSLLETLGGFYYDERGIIPIKGKGEMRTYWLTGEDPSRTRRNSADSARSESEPPTMTNCSPELGNRCTKASEEIGSGTDSANYHDRVTTRLLSECMSNGKVNLNEKPGRYMSCSNLFQECKASIRKELLKKNGTGSTNRFRSAPIVTFMESISPKTSYRDHNFV